MQHNTVAVKLLLVFLCVAVAQTTALSYTNRRALLQSNATEETVVEEVDEFALEQERKANESALIVAQARNTSTEAVARYLAAPGKNARLEVLNDLLRNADGVAFKFTVNTLVTTQDEKRSRVAWNLAHRAFATAVKEGFGTNAAQALVYAFTVMDAQDDYRNVLDALMDRMRKNDADKEGSGCQFMKNLFSDAEVFAYERNDAHAFYRAFESEEYLGLTECLLETCGGHATKCCRSKKANKRGRCGCNDSKDRCDYNIFSYQPRTIWVCSSSECTRNEKCLCPPAEE